MSNSPQSEQLRLWPQDAPISRQDARQRTAAPPVRHRGPKPGQPKTYGAWGDLPPDGQYPNRPAEFTPKIRRAMHLREISTGNIRNESRRIRAAAERATFFCNRLIENRFPQVNFSDMALLSSGCPSDYGFINREENNE